MDKVIGRDQEPECIAKLGDEFALGAEIAAQLNKLTGVALGASFEGDRALVTDFAAG